MNYLKKKYRTILGKINKPWLYRREDLLEDDVSFSELYDDEFRQQLGTFVGEWINQEYFLITLLGRGTFSVVYLAYSLQEREMVVIKMILPCYNMEGKYESNIIEKLYNSIEYFPYQVFKWKQHPKIICVKQPFLGLSVSDLMQKNSYKHLSNDTIITYFYDCLTSLNKIHNSNVVHCDLKLDNILTSIKNGYNHRLKEWFKSLCVNKYIHEMAWVYKRERENSILNKRSWSKCVKLAQRDFSVYFKEKIKQFEQTLNDEKIKDLEDVKEITDFDMYHADSLEDVDITNTIHIEEPHHAFIIDFGNSLLVEDIEQADICFESYRPPENILHMHISKKTDIWSLGCIFYEMLTDKRLFTLEDNQQINETRTSDGQISFNSIDTFDTTDMLDLIDEQRLSAMYILCNLDNTIRKQNIKHLLKLHCIFKMDDAILELISSVLSDMLQIDPEKRASCNMLLKNELFKPFVYDNLTDIDI